jgi:hypothetical protein
LNGFRERVTGAVQRAGFSTAGSGDVVGPTSGALDGGVRMTVVRVSRVGPHNRIQTGITAGRTAAGIGKKIGEGGLRIGYRNFETAA